MQRIFAAALCVTAREYHPDIFETWSSLDVDHSPVLGLPLRDLSAASVGPLAWVDLLGMPA